MFLIILTGERFYLFYNVLSWFQFYYYEQDSLRQNGRDITESLVKRLKWQDWFVSVLREIKIYFSLFIEALSRQVLLRDKLVTNVVIRATEGFNLHFINVARQVEEKCCPYYRTLTKTKLRNSEEGTTKGIDAEKKKNRTWIPKTDSWLSPGARKVQLHCNLIGNRKCPTPNKSMFSYT